MAYQYQYIPRTAEGRHEQASWDIIPATAEPTGPTMRDVASDIVKDQAREREWTERGERNLSLWRRLNGR